MPAVRFAALLGLLTAAAATAWAQLPSGEVPGLPGQGRVTWKTEGLDGSPVRLVRASHILNPPQVRIVFELTRDLVPDETLWLEGRLGPMVAGQRAPISAVLLDADGVPLAPLAALYQGFDGRTRRGDRFRLILQVQPEAWARAATAELGWAAPRPAVLPRLSLPRPGARRGP
jgi:hypothetical protein